MALFRQSLLVVDGKRSAELDPSKHWSSVVLSHRGFSPVQVGRYGIIDSVATGTLTTSACSARRPVYRLVFAAMPGVLQTLVCLRFPTSLLESVCCQMWIGILFASKPSPELVAVCMVGCRIVTTFTLWHVLLCVRPIDCRH